MTYIGVIPNEPTPAPPAPASETLTSGIFINNKFSLIDRHCTSISSSCNFAFSDFNKEFSFVSLLVSSVSLLHSPCTLVTFCLFTFDAERTVSYLSDMNFWLSWRVVISCVCAAKLLSVWFNLESISFCFETIVSSVPYLFMINSSFCPNSFTQGLLWDGGINVCGVLENIGGTNDEGNTEGFEVCFKVFPPWLSLSEKKGKRKKSRECHNHKPQPFPDAKRKRKPTNLNKHKPNKRTKSTKISSLFPKRGNRNAKRTEKHKNKITQGKTYNKSPRRINHKATKSKTNTGTTALEKKTCLFWWVGYQISSSYV